MTQVAELRATTRQPALGETVPYWIGGKRVPGPSGRRGPVFDPARGVVAREVDFASIQEVDAAVAAARAAFPGWRATSLSKRTDIMFRIRNLVDTHRHELAAHLTAEHGKVPPDALGEIARGPENPGFPAGDPPPLKGGLLGQ